MNDYSNQKQVNWQDGMKIEKKHFLDSDHFHIEQQQITRGILISEHNFGLLPSRDKTHPFYEIKFVLEGDMLKLSAFKLAVILLNGSIISIDSDQFNSKSMDLDNIATKFQVDRNKDIEYYLILKGNALEHHYFGNFNSKDLPLRRAHLLPYFEFMLVPAKKVKDAFFANDFLILAKLSISNSEVVVDQDYIPPVTSLISHSLLLNYHKLVYQSIIQIENYLIEIARKYSNMPAESFRDTLVILSNNILNRLSRIKFEVKHTLLFEPPIETVIRIKEIANVVNHTLSMRTFIGKDRFLSEVNHTLGASKFEFEEMIKQMINLEYRHYNISDAVIETRSFLENMTRIFKSLSEIEKTKKARDIVIKRD